MWVQRSKMTSASLSDVRFTNPSHQWSSIFRRLCLYFGMQFRHYYILSLSGTSYIHKSAHSLFLDLFSDRRFCCFTICNSRTCHFGSHLLFSGPPPRIFHWSRMVNRFHNRCSSFSRRCWIGCVALTMYLLIVKQKNAQELGLEKYNPRFQAENI